jgi:branched-chain amino acid transport system permease protein
MKQRISFTVFMTALILLPFLLRFDEYWLNVVNLLYLTAVLLLSLNYIFGYSGQLTLCHGTFMGIGGYAVAILVSRNAASFWTATLVGVGACILISFVLGRLTVKLREFYIAVATLVVAMAADIIFAAATGITGGPQGLAIADRPSIMGIPLHNQSRYYYLCLALLVGTFYVMRRLSQSGTGIALRSIGQNEEASISLGINIAKHKLVAFVLGSTIAGVAGSVFVGMNLYINPTVCNMSYSFILVAGLVVGGLGSVGSNMGAIIGAIVLILLPEQLREFGEHKVFIFSAIMFFFILFMPSGIYGFLMLIRERILGAR